MQTVKYLQSAPFRMVPPRIGAWNSLSLISVFGCVEPNVLLGLKPPGEASVSSSCREAAPQAACSVLAIGSNRPEVIAFRPLLPRSSLSDGLTGSQSCQ